MRRILTAITATALALSLVAQATPAQAAVPGYFSSFFGESAFLNLQQGSTGQFVAIFTNTGGTGWLRNSASQVNLGVCLSDKTTCNVTSPNSAWNDGSWLSNIAYATHSTDFVGPGQNGFFVYNVRAPLSATAGATYTFNGDLVLGSTLQQLAPQGYYQSATVQNAAAPSTSTTCFYTGVGAGIQCNGTATAPTGTTMTNVSAAWADQTASTNGSLACTPDDGAFSSAVEAFTCTGADSLNGDLASITITSTASNSTTGTETKWIGDTVAPVCGLAPAAACVLGTQGTSEFNHATGGYTDALTPISRIQYRVLNQDATTKIDWTTLPAADGAYNEKTESFNFRVDTTGFANGTYILEVRATDGAGNTSGSTILKDAGGLNLTVSSGADTTAPDSHTFTATYPKQSGLKVVTKGTAGDSDGTVANVEVKVQRNDAGVWTDVNAYQAATPDDGAFNETSENYTQTTTDLTIPNNAQVRVITRVTDAGGNQATFTSGNLSTNGGLWNSAGTGGDSVKPTIGQALTQYATYNGGTCFDHSSGALVLNCGVTNASDTQGSSNSLTFTGRAVDDVGVTLVEYAVNSPGVTGTTVIGWTPCSANNGFGGTLVDFTCSITLPTTSTAQTGNQFIIMVRAGDAAGNKSVPADPNNGAFSANTDGNQVCSFFRQQYVQAGTGAATTGNCIWTYDNNVPFISTAVKARDAGTGATTVSGGGDTNSDIIALQFSEDMRRTSTTTPQSITITDNVNGSLTLTNGVNATFFRCGTGTVMPTSGSIALGGATCASVTTENAGDGQVWMILVGTATTPVNSAIIYPSTITGTANLRDIAGNSVTLAAGDKTID